MDNDLTESQRGAFDTLCSSLTQQLWNDHHLLPNHLILWNVNLATISHPSDSLSPGQSVILLKFLRARDFVVSNAVNMLVECLKWRRDNNLSSILSETFPDVYNELGQVYGHERDTKYPVTYNYYGNINIDTLFTPSDTNPNAGPAQFIRWRVQLMEKALSLLDLETYPNIDHIMQVHDYQGASMRPRGTMREVTKEIITLFSDNYPECLSRKLFVNVPPLMDNLFSIISLFSPPKTKAKFRMIGPAYTRSSLWDWIDANNVPDRYGGHFPSQTTIHDFNIGARSSSAAWLPVQPGQSIIYHVVTGGLDINVTIATSEFLPTGVTDPDGILKLQSKPSSFTSLVSQKGEIISGTETAKGTGFTCLLVDNSYSLITSKVIKYSFTVISSESNS